jgi:N-acetylmuramoyl-L-alanine amidase
MPKPPFRRFPSLKRLVAARRIAWAVLAGSGLSGLGAALADQPAAPVSAVAGRLETVADHARLLFELTGPAKPAAHVVANPARVIVDLPDVAFRIDAQSRVPGSSKLVKSYRYGQFAPGRSRVVVDLAGPVRIVRAETEPESDGKRLLVVELAPTSEAHFSATAAESASEAVNLAPPPAQTANQPAPASDKPVVVIDPGHGGVDMGATGKHGEQEKAIVFEFAKALAAKIEAGGRLKAALTRNEDVFLPLNERVRLAHQNNAALFLSIHADTLAEGHVEGATVYTVSAKASDAEAARIAEKENLADKAAGLDSKEDVEQVGDILFELTQRETRAFSAQFSQTLISRWKEAASLNKNPSRAAGFVVLKSYDIPSVLLELGYLSSEKDLERLTSSEWRDRAAGKTAEAIEAFFAARLREARAPAAPPRPQ